MPRHTVGGFVKMNADDVTKHVLSIIHGITGVTFEERKWLMAETPIEDVGSYYWTSHQIPVSVGPLLLVAKDVRLQISFPLDTSDYSGTETLDGIAVKLDQDGLLRVQCAYIFTRYDGGEFSSMRVLNFRGPHFHHFD